MVPYGDLTVYFSSIGERHLRYPEKLRSQDCGAAEDFRRRRGGFSCSAAAAAAAAEASAAAKQGLTLVHVSAQRKHFFWDALGTFGMVALWVMTRRELDTKRLTDQNG
jgi:hypothetical protein